MGNWFPRGSTCTWWRSCFHVIVPDSSHHFIIIRVLVRTCATRDLIFNCSFRSMTASQTIDFDPTFAICAESESPASLSPSIVSTSPAPPTPSCSRKRPADSDVSSLPHCKGRRSSEEEKLARRLARQQRNRKSAQVSREKKKAYVDQLEHDLAVLRAEKQETSQREKEAIEKCAKLELKVEELSGKLRQFESVFEVWIKPHLHATNAGSLVASACGAESQCMKKEGEDCEVNSSMSDVVLATAAPAAALTMAGPSSPIDSNSSGRTCLPAVETTNYSPKNGMALQRVLLNQNDLYAMVTRTTPCRRPVQQPTAAALLRSTHQTQTHPSCSKNSLSTTCSPAPCRMFPSTLNILTSRCTHSPRYQTQFRSSTLRLRLKIPQGRLKMVLRKYVSVPAMTA